MSLRWKQGVQFNAETMTENYRGSYDDFEARFGAPWYFSHRVDLHNELRRLATEPSAKNPGATLNLAAPVTEIDCEKGILKLENGSIVHKDVIVGADGIHVSFHALLKIVFPDTDFVSLS
jgi:salicylate hydroxylase